MKEIRKFADLLGETIVDIIGAEKGSEQMVVHLKNGRRFELCHVTDCCESVDIEDICGDLKDLIGSPLTMAEEVTSDTNPDGVKKEYQDSFTWTFYKLATVNGYVTIRWYGESNGYYSEKAYFGEVIK